MGGSNINSPLKEIYNDNSYSEINLDKHIFLLTDGQVNDREGCINLISSNSNKFRLHSFGIGNDFDKYFIERSGKLGKGSYFFIEDVEKVGSIIIKALSECLRQYLTDTHLNFQNYQNEIKNNIISCDPKEIIHFDEIINYSFILDEKNNINIDKLLEPISIELSAKRIENIIKKNISFNKNEYIIKLPDGDELSKMIVGKALKKNKELIEDKNKEIEFSIKYQIVSKNTALFAEIINYDKDFNQPKLITVNLNDYIPEFVHLNSFKKKYKSHKNKRTDIPAYTYDFNNLVGGVFSYHSYSIDSFDIPMSSIKDTKYSTSSCSSSDEKPIEVIEGLINNKKFEKKDIMKIILSQNIIEGYWDENEETKELMNIIKQESINKIITNIKSLNKGEDDEKKIKYTILVIYYLNTEYSDKLDEYKLIISKAKKYLLNQGIQYEDIIKGL